MTLSTVLKTLWQNLMMRKMKKRQLFFILNKTCMLTVLKKLRSLAALLIDSIIESTTEEELMNNNLDILYEENVALVDRMSFAEEKLIVLEAENIEVNVKIKGVE